MTTANNQKRLVDEYVGILEPLFSLESVNAFELVCTLLRVGGDRSTGWDPFQESREFLDDVSVLARVNLPKDRFPNTERTRMRMALASYDRVVGMQAPYQVIANLLRVKGGMTYVDDPFFHLKMGAMKKSGKRKPIARDIALGPKRKIDEIKRLAELVDCPRIGEAFDDFYYPDIHHAINLSDYVLDGGELRMLRRPAPAKKTPVDTSVAGYEVLTEMVARAHAYFLAFIRLEAAARKRYKRYKGKCVPYDPNLKGLLELLIDDEGDLCGIKVHWPNKTESVFRRKGVRCESTNVTFDADGSVNFFVGEYFDDHNQQSPLVPKDRALEYTLAEGSAEPPGWPAGLEKTSRSQ